MESKRNKQNECSSCKYRENIPGNCHIKCNKPDPNMKGNPYGRRSGWFFYPINFDPAWKEVDCANYKEMK